MAKKPTKPTRHRAPWTKGDLAKLKKLAVRSSAGVIAEELDRTEAAIRRKAGLESISMKPTKR